MALFQSCENKITMALSLIDLAVLIELVEKQLDEYEQQSKNPENSEQVQDDYSELIVTLGITAGNLQGEYDAQYFDGTSLPTYDELIDGIRARLEKSA